MNIDYLVLAAVAWITVIPWLIAVWFSPQALLWIKRRLVARADALTAARAVYKEAHDAAMSAENGYSKLVVTTERTEVLEGQ